MKHEDPEFVAKLEKAIKERNEMRPIDFQLEFKGISPNIKCIIF